MKKIGMVGVIIAIAAISSVVLGVVTAIFQSPMFLDFSIPMALLATTLQLHEARNHKEVK